MYSYFENSKSTSNQPRSNKNIRKVVPDYTEKQPMTVSEYIEKNINYKVDKNKKYSSSHISDDFVFKVSFIKLYA